MSKGKKISVKGIVEKVYTKVLPSPDRFENTHSHSLYLKDLGWVGFPSNKMDAFMIEIDGKWKVLGAGSEVFVQYTQNGDFRNAKKNDLMIVEFVEGEKFNPNNQDKTSSSSSAPQGKGKKPNNSIVAGNARTAAFNFLKNKPYKDAEEVKKLIRWMAEYSNNKRKEYAESNPSLSEFEVGVGVGQALTSVASIAKSAKDINPLVDEYLGVFIPYSEYGVNSVLAGNGWAEQEDEPETEEVEEQEEDEFDDDVPF